MFNATPVTVAYGGGIGPEIMAASLHIAPEAGARMRKAVALLNRLLDPGIEIVQPESLRAYAGKPGYTLSQGR